MSQIKFGVDFPIEILYAHIMKLIESIQTIRTTDQITGHSNQRVLLYLTFFENIFKKNSTDPHYQILFKNKEFMREVL